VSAQTVTGPRRHIWLCADDYGISRAVNTAIRELIMRGRINATSVMVAAPHFDRADAASLTMLNADTPRAAIGLHVTLTGPFRPLSNGFRPLTADGAFPSLRQMLRLSVLRRLHHETLGIEIAMQLRAFVTAFGQPPDFIDGHQHVHLFPQIRDALFRVVTQAAPRAWVRQCGRASPLHRRLGDHKGHLLDILSRQFRRAARHHGVRTNSAFAGTYNFAANADFAKLFPGFIKHLPENGLVMCHPGFVDAELKRLDPLTTLREKEFAYLNGEAFPGVLAANGVTLA
jgi:predicted glycoside hydrolase/deacetylase ChbG (UPF0249 family)